MMFAKVLVAIFLSFCQGRGLSQDSSEYGWSDYPPVHKTWAQDRMDTGKIPTIDTALLRQVLEDPVLLQAVDPQVGVNGYYKLLPLIGQEIQLSSSCPIRARQLYLLSNHSFSW